MRPGPPPNAWRLPVPAALGVALLVGSAPGRPAQPPPPERAVLTAQEVAARLEKAGKDPVALLEIVPLADAGQAARIRERVKTLLHERKQLAGPEGMDLLTRRVARVLPAAAHSPVAVRELLGVPRVVLRQVLYRRHVEQWHYDSPLSLCVVLQTLKGQNGRVQTVLLPGAAKP